MESVPMTLLLIGGFGLIAAAGLFAAGTWWSSQAGDRDD